MLAHYHADGNDSDATVMFEYAEMKETIRIEFLHQKTSSYMDFIKTKGNRKRLMIILSLGLFSQWSGNALVSYYASIIYEGAGITSQTDYSSPSHALCWSIVLVDARFSSLRKCTRSLRPTN
jgi:hypothetical protein